MSTLKYRQPISAVWYQKHYFEREPHITCVNTTYFKKQPQSKTEWVPDGPRVKAAFCLSRTHWKCIGVRQRQGYTWNAAARFSERVSWRSRWPQWAESTPKCPLYGKAPQRLGGGEKMTQQWGDARSIRNDKWVRRRKLLTINSISRAARGETQAWLGPAGMDWPSRLSVCARERPERLSPPLSHTRSDCVGWSAARRINLAGPPLLLMWNE